MKKILALCMAVFLVAGMGLSVPVLGAGANRFTHGNFETFRESNIDSRPLAFGPMGWLAQSPGGAENDWDSFIVTEDDGNHYLSLPMTTVKGSSSDDRMITTGYIDATPGETLAIAFRYYSTQDLLARVAVVAANGDEEKTKNAEASDYRNLSATGGGWQRGVLLYTVPESFERGGTVTTTDIKITVRSYSYYIKDVKTDKLYFDDITVTPTSADAFAHGGMEAVENNMPAEWYVTAGEATASSEAYQDDTALSIGADASVITNIPVAKGNYKLTGYVKLAASATVTISAHSDNAGGTLLGAKTITGTGAWQRVALNGLAAGNGGIALQISATGAALVDAFSIMTDSNIITNGGFEGVTGSVGAVTAVAKWAAIKEGTQVKYDAEHGYYFEISSTAGNNQVVQQQTNIPVTVGDTYKISFLYKSNGVNGKIRVNYKKSSGDAGYYIYFNTLPSTNDEWKTYESVVTVPTDKEVASMALEIRSGDSMTSAATNYFACDDFAMELISASEAGFYNTGSTSGLSSSNGYYACCNMGTVSEKLAAEEAYTLRYYDMAYTAGNAPYAVAAIYEKVGTVKQLVQIVGMGQMTDLTDGGTINKGYELALSAVDTLEEGKAYTLEGFIWNSSTGIKPILPKVVIAK